jgi:hypothetical protein
MYVNVFCTFELIFMLKLFLNIIVDKNILNCIIKVINCVSVDFVLWFV